MASSTRRSSSALALDTYDPFGTSSSSFLPPMGLFSPVAAAPSPSTSRSTPNFCATIFEEEDAEESCASSSTTITPSTPDNDFQRRQSAFAIHPRILRSDSCSDDDSDIPPVLRFPVPPSTIPSSSRSPPKLKPVSIPPPPPQLKSCFEDDDDDEQQQVVVAPSPVASRRSSPTALTTLMASRPAPPPPSKPFALLKKATSALKSSSPPRSSSSSASKPLPKVPHAQRPRITPAPYNDEQQPISVSPTPSLSSSSSSSDCSSATLPYIPVGSIIPAPAIVQDLDDYLETLEMYFPSELWEDHPHELRRKPNSAAAKSRSSSSSSSSSAHRKRPSNSSSSSSCSRSSSDENLQHRRKSSFDDAAVDVQRLLKNSASSGNMKLASYTSTSSTTVRISSPLSPPAEIRSHSRSGSDSPTSTAYSSSSSSCSSSSSPSNSSTITPGSRTPSPTFAKHTTPLSPPKSILKPSKSSPLLRDRSTSVSSTFSVVSPPPVPRSSSRSSSYANVPMSPTRGRAPVPMHQLLSR